MAHSTSFKERIRCLTSMAESKLKTATRGPTAKNTKESKLWSLVCLAREVAADADGIQDFSQLIAEGKSLKDEVGEKAKEILHLKQELAQHKSASFEEKTSLIRQFGEQYKMFATEKAASAEGHRERVSRLEAELKAMDERDQQQQEERRLLDVNVRTTQSALDRLKKRMENTEKDSKMLRSHLEAANKKCDELETKLRTDLGQSFFHRVDEARAAKLREHLALLSSECYKIVKEFLSSTDSTPAPIALLQNLQIRFADLPLSATKKTTKESLLMRRAAGQAIICEALMTSILCPFYITDDLKEPACRMLELLADDQKQQQLYRYQVLRSLKDEEEVEPSEDAVMEASDAITKALYQLVSPTRLEEFRHKIEIFLRQAAQMWEAEAQQATLLMEVVMPKGNENESAETYSDYGIENASKGVALSNHRVAATLFPRVTLQGQVLHRGCVVWSDSPAVLAAKTQISTGPVSGRLSTNRRNGRRNSVTGVSSSV